MIEGPEHAGGIAARPALCFFLCRGCFSRHFPRKAKIFLRAWKTGKIGESLFALFRDKFFRLSPLRKGGALEQGCLVRALGRGKTRAKGDSPFVEPRYEWPFWHLLRRGTGTALLSFFAFLAQGSSRAFS